MVDEPSIARFLETMSFQQDDYSDWPPRMSHYKSAKQGQSLRMEAMILVCGTLKPACFHILSNFYCDGVTDISVGKRERQDTYLRHDLHLRLGIGRYMGMEVDRRACTYPIH